MFNTLKKRLKYFPSVWALRNGPYNVDILLHGSHVVIYPEINVCFNRIKKSGNTTISAFLTDVSNNFAKETDKGFKKPSQNPETSRRKSCRTSHHSTHLW